MLWKGKLAGWETKDCQNKILTGYAGLADHILKLMQHLGKARHTVVCQQPRKQKKTLGTQVCFTGTIKLPNSAFCISKTTKPISPPNLYIFCLTHTKLKEIASVFLKIFVPENCLIFFTFSLHKITNIFKSHKNNLPMFCFLSNLEHQ